MNGELDIRIASGKTSEQVGHNGMRRHSTAPNNQFTDDLVPKHFDGRLGLFQILEDTYRAAIQNIAGLCGNDLAPRRSKSDSEFSLKIGDMGTHGRL